MASYLFLATFVAFIVSFLWLRHIYHLDIHRKESKKLLAKVFLFGCLSAIPAFFMNEFSMLIGGMIFTFIMVGFVEEGVKFAAVKFSVSEHEDFDEPIDGILFAGTAALGFAFIENILYNFQGLMNPEITSEILIMRGFTPFLHLLLSGIWGASFGLYKMGYVNKWSLYKIIILMAIAHSAYDLGTMFLPEEMSLSYMTLVLVGLSAVFYRKIDALNAISPYKQENKEYIKADIKYCASCGEVHILQDKFCKKCGYEH